jgi:hypothetical protein
MSTNEKQPAPAAASARAEAAGPQKLLMAGVVIILLALAAMVWLIATGRGAAPATNNSAEANSAEAAAPVTRPPTPGGGRQLPSGLRLETVREGTGPLVTATDTVAFRYELRTVGGPVIETNQTAPQAATMPVAGLVPGFQEGLTHMRAGGEARFWIPPYLGYGDSPPGEGIGPTDTLEFRVRVERIVPAGAPPAAPAAGNSSNVTNAATEAPTPVPGQ